jgi:hypothetical protein
LDVRPSGRAMTDSSERAWAVAFGWRSGDGPSGLEPLAGTVWIEGLRVGCRRFNGQQRERVSRGLCGRDEVHEGSITVCYGPGSSFEEDGEDQVERPRSRPVKQNQSCFYSRVLDPEGRIQLRERLPRRATDAGHGQRPSGSESPASGHATASCFGGVLDRERGHLRLRA